MSMQKPESGAEALCSVIGIGGAEVARRIGVSRTAVSRWARGIDVPSPSHRLKLDREFSIAAESWANAAEREIARRAVDRKNNRRSNGK